MNKYKTTALIGYTGFVGFNLNMKYDFTHKYNSKNYQDMQGQSYDCVVCAGISATKWWANGHPDEDMANIMKLINILDTIKTNKFVLISTIDVYDNIEGGDEETIIDSIKNHPYGKNRFWVETWAKDKFEDWLIIRLPALFGYGLKKNIIYDYLNGTLKEMNIKSSFQWYNVGNLFRDLNKVLRMKGIINLFPEPIPNDILCKLFDKYKQRTYNIVDKNFINYDVQTIYGTYVDNIDNILREMRKYINNMLNGKLTISNLAWKHNDNKRMLDELKVFGINVLEVGPNKYFSGEDNCPVYSFQALMYPYSYNMFEERHSVMEHLKLIMRMGKRVGAKILVFGSPKNRLKGDREGFMDYAVDFFKELCDLAEYYKVIIAIEPNAKLYGCDFITNSKEGRDLVLRVSNPWFRLHLDVGCMQLENENIMDCIKTNLDILAHIHFSAPYLKSLRENVGMDYRKLYHEIREFYEGMISIEMLGQEDIDVLRDVQYVLGI